MPENHALTHIIQNTISRSCYRNFYPLLTQTVPEPLQTGHFPGYESGPLYSKGRSLPCALPSPSHRSHFTAAFGASCAGSFPQWLHFRLSTSGRVTGFSQFTQYIILPTPKNVFFHRRNTSIRSFATSGFPSLVTHLEAASMAAFHAVLQLA